MIVSKASRTDLLTTALNLGNHYHPLSGDTGGCHDIGMVVARHIIKSHPPPPPPPPLGELPYGWKRFYVCLPVCVYAQEQGQTWLWRECQLPVARLGNPTGLYLILAQTTPVKHLFPFPCPIGGLPTMFDAGGLLMTSNRHWVSESCG